MATLTVWKFPTTDGAANAESTLLELAIQHLIVVQDAAIAYWPEGAKKPKTQQANSMKAAGTLGGSFWGLLFGILFFVPFLGLAVGAAMGALAGSLSDVGINDDFIRTVRDEITPGTSALFVMSSEAVVDKVHAAFEGQPMELVKTNLSNEEEAKLREVFSE